MIDGPKPVGRIDDVPLEDFNVNQQNQPDERRRKKLYGSKQQQQQQQQQNYCRRTIVLEIPYLV